MRIAPRQSQHSLAIMSIMSILSRVVTPVAYRLLALLLLLATPAYAAGPLHEATLRFDPAAPFVGQPFRVSIEVTVTPGVDLENLVIDGLPDASQATFVNLVRGGRETRRTGQRAVDILRYSAEGRALRPFAANVACTLRGLAVERVSGGFFSHTRSVPAAIRTPAAALAVRDLPLEGRPPDFSGAVGRFTLSGKAEPLTVAPNDLVTLSYTLSGSGWLADAALSLPELGPVFKAYPAQEVAREAAPPRIVLSQVVLPLSTNAAVIATPRFVYFDPDAADYHIATLEPFRLTFAQSTSTEPAVRRIDATPTVRATENGSARPPELALAETVAKLRQLLPLAAALILAAGVTAALYRVRRTPAVLAGILILGLGVAASRRLSRDAEARVLEVTASAVARLAPSEQALPLFDLHPGATVIPLEHAPGWVRVRASGREAWIPLSSIKPQ